MKKIKQMCSQNDVLYSDGDYIFFQKGRLSNNIKLQNQI